MKNHTKFLLLTIMLISSGAIFGQIELSNESSSKKDKQKVKELKSDTQTSSDEFIIYSNWSVTNRDLSINEGLFGDPLGEREFESNLNIWSFGLGFRQRSLEHLSWEGGLSFLRNGESYLFEGTDSTFSYNTSYSYVGMPIKLYYTVGNQFRFYAGGGVIPQMFFQYRQDQEWTDPTNNSYSETYKFRNGYSQFVLALVLNVGGQLNLGNAWSIYAMPEYRYQITDSYTVTDSYNHFGRAMGITFGLTRTL